jgi:thymidine phosphorylase
MHAKPGDPVRAGQPLLTLHTDEPDRFERATEALAGAYTIGAERPHPSSLIISRVSGA